MCAQRGGLALWAGLQQLVYTGFNQFAARLEHPCQHALTRQTAIDEDNPSLPAADTPPVMRKALQIHFNALAYGSRCIRGLTGTSTESFHGFAS